MKSLVSNNIHVTLICERLRLHLCPIAPRFSSGTRLEYHSARQTRWEYYSSALAGKHMDQKYTKYSMELLFPWS